MKLDNYIQAGKGRREKEFNRLTGKSMRIGSELKKRFAGLSREEMAERLIEEHQQKRGSDTGETDKQQFVLHSLVLRPGRTAHLELPFDLSPQEAEKLTKFIQILQSNPE